MVQRTEQLLGHRPRQLLVDGIYATLSTCNGVRGKGWRCWPRPERRRRAGAGGRLPKAAFVWTPRGRRTPAPRAATALRQRTTEKREGEVTLTVLVYRAEARSVSRAPGRRTARAIRSGAGW